MSVTVNANVSSDVLEGATATFSKLIGIKCRHAANKHGGLMLVND